MSSPFGQMSSVRVSAAVQAARLPLDELVRFAKSLQEKAIEPRTRQDYDIHLRRYVEFCAIYGYGEDVRPTVEKLHLYISFLIRELSSVQGYLSGLAFHLEPMFSDWPSVRNHPVVLRTLVGALKHRAHAPRRRDPLTLTQLDQIVRHAERPSATYDDRLFALISTLGFHNMHRLGELVSATAVPSWEKSIKWASVRCATTNGADTFTYVLPYHKADRLFKSNEIQVMKTASVSDPTRLFRRYVIERTNKFGRAPFLFMRADGSVPTRSWFIDRLKAFKFAGNVGGHSLRAGGATFYASIQVDVLTIKRWGRWSSEAWEAYVRSHPSVSAAVLARAMASAVLGAPTIVA